MRANTLRGSKSDAGRTSLPGPHHCKTPLTAAILHVA
jgi:hypothetical protein